MNTRFALSVFAIALASCASIPEPVGLVHDGAGYCWVEAPSRPPIRNVVVITKVELADFTRRCGADWTKVAACVERRSDIDTCYIVTWMDDLNGYVDWHERQHCAGFSHHPRWGARC